MCTAVVCWYHLHCFLPTYSAMTAWPENMPDSSAVDFTLTRFPICECPCEPPETPEPCPVQESCAEPRQNFVLKQKGRPMWIARMWNALMHIIHGNGAKSCQQGQPESIGSHCTVRSCNEEPLTYCAGCYNDMCLMHLMGVRGMWQGLP